MLRLLGSTVYLCPFNQERMDSLLDRKRIHAFLISDKTEKELQKKVILYCLFFSAHSVLNCLQQKGFQPYWSFRTALVKASHTIILFNTKVGCCHHLTCSLSIIWHYWPWFSSFKYFLNLAPKALAFCGCLLPRCQTLPHLLCWTFLPPDFETLQCLKAWTYLLFYLHLHLWWVHFIFTFKYRLYANGCPIYFSSSFVFLGAQTHILSLYLLTPIWMPSKHLKLNMSQTQPHYPHPTSPPSFQLMATSSQKVSYHSWLLPFLMSYRQASSVSEDLCQNMSKVWSLITLTMTTLVTATIISGLNYYNNLLTDLPGSSSHCNLFSK